ncbi:MAG: hypothetical protein ISS49_09310 [Anaerolineae bacterium]|nr:hypothetical protein [Anaerolineae bacterium]
MGKRRDLTIGVAVFFLLLWALLTHSHVNSWNDASRLATVEALVHNGTWAIEDTAFGNLTGDRIFLNGHFYSDKPPVLSLLAAGVYAVLHRGLHLSFDPSVCDPVASPCYCFALLCPQSPDWAYYLLTLTLVGLPSALMLALFYRITAFHDISNPLALLVTGVLGLGTLIFPYSLAFNNHVPTATCLMIGFYALLRAKIDAASRTRFLLVAGFATALAFTFDLVAVPFLVFFLGYALLRHRRRAWPFLLGSLLPLGLLAALDWWILGDPLPPTMHARGFDYPGSPFPSTIAGTGPSTEVLEYGFRMIFGDRGLFGLNPVLLWAVFGLWSLLRERSHGLWGETVAVVLASLVVVFCLILLTEDFGGLAYGTRWLVDISPLLFFFAARPTLYRSLSRRLLFAALAALSLFSAWQGAISPWGLALPPLHLLEYTVSAVGRYVESLPADTVVYATPPRVHYLPLFPVHAWHSSLREFDAASGMLPAGDPDRLAVYVLSADDQATGGLLEAVLPHGQWDLVAEGFTVYRVPPGVDRVRPREPLQAEFAGRIRLLGCDPPPESLRPGDTLTVQLYWRALAPIERGYTAFVHLLGPPNPFTGNLLWAQDDHQPGHTTYPTDHWLPGEVVLDWFRFVIPDDAPPGEYVLTTGFYDLATLQRLARSDAHGDTVTLFHVNVVP